MKEKIVSLTDAAAGVKDGMLVGMTTSALDDAPLAFLRELARQRKRNLRVATLPSGGLNADFLIGSGVVGEYETSACSLGDLGPAPNFQRAILARKLQMKDST